MPVPCQGLSLAILAYATNLDYASLKYGRSLHNMLSHLQTTGSSHANISTPLKCTITVSHIDCALLHLHASSYIMLRLAPNNVYIHLVIISWLLIIRVTPANFRGRFDGNEKIKTRIKQKLKYCWTKISRITVHVHHNLLYLGS